MKKGLFMLVLSLVFCSGYASARHRNDGNRGYSAYEKRDYRNRSPYFVTGNTVFFDGNKIDGASASSFSTLRDGYAKDSWTVYFCGIKIDGASSNSFKALGYGYAKDTWNVYYNGVKIEGASSDSFNVLSDRYAKDTWDVYYDGEKIPNASPDSFDVLRDGYAKDTWDVYFDGEKIPGASPDSFKVLRNGYARDSWNTYYCGRKNRDINVNNHTVKVTKSGFKPYQYDNGDDYVSDGCYRIVDKDGKIGYASENNTVIISPRFAFGFPFKNGRAKVTDTGHLKEVEGSNGEYHYWVSGDWYWIDKMGNRIEIGNEPDL